MSQLFRNPIAKRRVLVLAAISVVASFSVTSDEPAVATSRSRMPVQEEYQPDFSSSSSRGVGFRLTHSASGLYLDVRLKGYPPGNPFITAREKR